MKITTISKIIDTINTSELSEEERSNIRFYAPYVIQKDPIGLHHVKSIINSNRIDKLIKALRWIFIIWYLFFLIIFPIFYNNLNEIPFFYYFKMLSLGLSDYLYNIKWYWELLFHGIVIISLFIIFFILDDVLDIDWSSSYKSRNKLNEYILLLNKKKSFCSDSDHVTSNKERHKKEIINKSNTNNANLTGNVFIVHGHDESIKYEVARFIEKMGLKAIILHEQISKGKTIIEKIENYSNVIYAIVLLSPDDTLNTKSKSSIFRARQNVIFEFGYLMAKLGREKICALVKENVEIPSDISGFVYVTFDKEGAWKLKVAKEMKEIGIKVDFDKLY